MDGSRRLLSCCAALMAACWRCASRCDASGGEGAAGTCRAFIPEHRLRLTQAPSGAPGAAAPAGRPAAVPGGADLMTNLSDREFLRRLETGVSNLPRRQRDIFLAHRVHGLDYEEIGRRTGLTRARSSGRWRRRSPGSTARCAAAPAAGGTDGGELLGRKAVEGSATAAGGSILRPLRFRASAAPAAAGTFAAPAGAWARSAARRH
jgi:hypothetical protein